MALTAGPRRHETGALLRAHLAAASGYRHATRHCPVCARLLKLAMESGGDGAGTEGRGRNVPARGSAPERRPGPE
jgi:hypothetical protein